jgi:hypothetical protein
MEMDTGVVMLSLLFGSVGLGMFMYGRKAGRVIPLGAGAILMILPYFITNLLAMTLVCCALMASPWIIRE